MKIKFKRAGFTLLEMIIAVGIFALVMATVAVVFNQMIYIYQNMVDKAEVAQQAANALEWLRRDIQSSPSLYETTDTSLGLQSGVSYIEYNLQGNTLTRTSDCGVTNYTVAEGVVNFDGNYYNAKNQEVSNPANNPSEVKAIELNITTTKRNQTFNLNTVVDFNLQPEKSLWVKTYGGNLADYLRSVRQTSDGGYILGGWSESFGAGAHDYLLIKTDASGNLQWARTYGGSSNEELRPINQTSDGGYVLGGWGFGAGNFFLIKTSSNGTLQWAKTYGGPGMEEIYSPQPTSDGGYILGGPTDSFGAGNWDCLLIKTSSNGTLQWAKTYGGTGGDWLRSLYQAADDGYIFSAWAYSFGAGGTDFMLIKTSSNGTLQWAKTYGGTGDERVRRHQPTADGGHILGGYTYSFAVGDRDFFLIKTDDDGDVVANCDAGSTCWARSYGGSGFEDITALYQASDGGYILGGPTYSFGAGDSDFLLIRTDANGTLQWAKTYGGAAFDEGYSLQQASDGGYILGGTTDSFGAGSSDFFLIKTDSQGETLNCCIPGFTVKRHGVDFNVIVTSPTPTVTSPTPTVGTPTPTVTSPTPTVTSPSPTETKICPQ